MNRFDVTVVGAGLAGLQCARLLARRGISVLIVDRKEDLRRGIHTTGIFVRRTLEDFDLSRSLLGPPVSRVVLHSPKGRTQVLESGREEFRIGRMGPIYEDLLRQAVLAGAVWRPRTAFLGLEEPSENETVVSLGEGQYTTMVRTRFIVGADGACSRVAAALGLGRNAKFIVGAEEVLEGVPLDGPAALHCFLDPILAPGYIGWVAHDGEQLHLGVGGCSPAFSPGPALAKLRRRVESLFDFSSSRLVERRGGRIPAGGILSRISNSRGLLIGDAAGAVSPLTAGGLDGAMRLSRFAADILAAAVEKDDGEILSLYSGAEFRARFLSRRWMRRVFAAVRSPLLVEAGCALLRTPPLSALTWRVFFGRGSFPEPDRAPLRALSKDVIQPIRSAGTTWTELVRLSALAESDNDLDEVAAKRITEINSALEPALRGRRDFSRPEDYVIHAIEGLEGANASELLERADVASLILSESGESLSPAIRETTLSARFSYSVHDLTVVDWNSVRRGSLSRHDLPRGGEPLPASRVGGEHRQKTDRARPHLGAAPRRGQCPAEPSARDHHHHPDRVRDRLGPLELNGQLSAAGISIVKTEPFPTTLSTVSSPRIARARSRLMASPRPTPWLLCELSTCVNGSKIASS